MIENFSKTMILRIMSSMNETIDPMIIVLTLATMKMDTGIKVGLARGREIII